MPLRFADSDAPVLPLHAVRREDLADWRAEQEPRLRGWLEATEFRAGPGDVALLPGADGGLDGAVAGLGDADARRRERFVLASAAAALPAGNYRLTGGLAGAELEEAALGWLLAGYRFDRYKPRRAAGARLVAPEGIDARRLETIAAGEALTRDLINTPAADMGPEALEGALAALAGEFGAELAVTRGAALQSAGLPLIHTVGRAAAEEPRLIDMRWGGSGPRLTLVGKGVCFDTGGLNIKPAASIGLMKKDMGGAATVVGLARMIMAQNWPVRLRVLVPAVENAISAGAFRPQDILTARNGLTIEVNNTDAEGRLVLADALALADEEHPDCLISMATLTGAARVALGGEIPALFTHDDALAAALAEAAGQVRDPLWRMPLWPGYERMIEPGIADLDNAPSGGMAGAVTAALFVHRFVAHAPRFAHFDIYGWQQRDAPARPKGGLGQGARALLQALPGQLGL